jgi:hypothetical protein
MNLFVEQKVSDYKHRKKNSIMSVIDLKKSPTAYLDNWLHAVLDRVTTLEEKMAQKDARIEELERKITIIIMSYSREQPNCQQPTTSSSYDINPVTNLKINTKIIPNICSQTDEKEIKNGQLFDSYQEFQKTFQKFKEETSQIYTVTRSSKFKTVTNPKQPYEYQSYKCNFKDCSAGFRISLRTAGKYAGQYIILKSCFEHHSHDRHSQKDHSIENNSIKKKDKKRSLVSSSSSSPQNATKFSKVYAYDDDEELSDYDEINYESNEDVYEDYNKGNNFEETIGSELNNEFRPASFEGGNHNDDDNNLVYNDNNMYMNNNFSVTKDNTDDQNILIEPDNIKEEY